jgi:hypothetical protein
MAVELGVYCETLAPEELAEPRFLDLVAEFRLTLGHALVFNDAGGAFSPDHAARHLELAAKVRAAGGRYGIWPLLPKSMGYWPNERNIHEFDRLADTLLASFERYGHTPELIVIDPETPWQQMAAVFFPGPPPWSRALSLAKMLLGNRNPRRFAWATARLREIVGRFQQAGCEVSSAAFPFLIGDLINDGHALQDYLEMPVFPVPFDGFNAMFYNSYLPTAAAPLLPPGSAPRFLFEYAGELAARYGDRAWVTLGSTWEGVIPGNAGHIYRAPVELTDDVAAAKAAGIQTLWLYCLEGVLFSDHALTARRKTSESAGFFSVLRDTPSAEPAQHAGWAARRRLFERLTRDRLRWAYGW